MHSSILRLGAVTLLLALGTSTVQAGTPLCSNQVCISANVYSADPTNVEFTLSALMSNVGWLGVGVGGGHGMAGNSLALCWHAADGSTVISERRAPSNQQPSPTGASPFTIVPAKSGFNATSKLFTCTFSRAIAYAGAPLTLTGASTSNLGIIYAVGTQAVSSSDPTTLAIAQHQYTGSGTLQVAQVTGSSANTTLTPLPSGRGGSGKGTLENYNMLVKTHGIMMAIAFLLVLPFGAILARFFGESSLFRFHRPTQLLGIIVAFAAFIIIIVAFSQSPSPKTNFTSSTHATVGLVLIIMMLLQGLLGAIAFHTFDPERTKRPLIDWIHKGFAYVVLLTGFCQVALGIYQYGMWPTYKEPVWIAYDVYVGVLIVGFIVATIVQQCSRRRRVDGYKW